MTRMHRKTRTGCAQCKRRRVKCREEKPNCANCVRNNLPCSLEFLTPMNFSCRSKSITSQVPKAPGTGFLTSDLLRELPWSSFDAQTSELLHHYNSVVSISLAGERKPHLWHVLMPQIGARYPFVLSGILSISALHLSKLIPNRRNELQKAALAQANTALPLFRASIDKPDAASIHSIFAFAGTVVYYIMALPDDAGSKGDRGRIPSRYDEYPHWFQAIRGLMALLKNHWDPLCRGPFASLLVHVPDPDHVFDNEDDEHLAKLEGMFSNSTCTSLDLTQDARNVVTCREALAELRRVFGLMHFPNRPNDEAWFRVWIGNMSQDFVELIFDRDPRALVILAHYCVLIKRQDHIWYLKGLGPRLLENIRQALGDEWRGWIKWPIEIPVSSETQ